MTPEQAADLAARTLTAIDRQSGSMNGYPHSVRDADRERVASDLAGLRDCEALVRRDTTGHAAHAARYADGLRLTARLYGVTE